MGEHVRAGDLDIWTEQVGEGSDVLLICGGGDTVESWQFQLDGLADRYRLTACDNRGAGRTAMPGGRVSVEVMADDAAGVLRALGIGSAHVAGFSGGSIVSQELALRYPELVRSLVLQSTWPVMDPYLRSWLLFVRWLVEVAPSERAFLEGFFLWIYTPRAHNDGTVDQFIEEVLAFPHKQTTENVQRFIDAFVDHDTTDGLPEIAAGEHERRGGDLRQPVGRVTGDEGVDEPLQVLGRLLVGEGQHLLDELVDGPVVVCPRGVDPQEEVLEERALARRELDQPADEEEPRAGVGVQHRPGALEHEAAHELGVAERQLLRDDAAAGEAGDVGGANVERAEDTGRVVRHHLRGDGASGHLGPARPAVVEGGQAVAVSSPSSWNCHDSTVSPRPPISSTSGPSPTWST